MKAHLRILTLAAALCVGLALPATAAEKHDHVHIATPKGGRVLDKTEPHAEFVIEQDRGVTVNFYSQDLKAVAVTTQSVVVFADAKEGKARLEFERKGDGLASKTKLPAGDGYLIIVQFKQTADAKPQNHRFKLDLSICGECKRAEYGCICDH
jgi:L-ascorbate metabolism protein UlaG (beta-lactamase superfamily)